MIIGNFCKRIFLPYISFTLSSYNSQLKLAYANLETVIYKYFVKLNVQMEEYYKLLSYQVEKSRYASDFTLDKIIICLFCNVSHLMNKIVYTVF